MHVSIYLFRPYSKKVRFVINDINFSGWDDKLVNEFIHGVTPILSQVKLKTYIL